MKKILILVIALALVAPAAVHAFSFVDVINFGKKLIKQDEQPTAAQTKKELTAAATQLNTLSAENKFDNWETAYLKHDVTGVLADSRNLYFTDAEINSLVDKELASATDPFARDVQVNFTDNQIDISGYSQVKNFTGQFSLSAKIVTVNNRINLQVTRARFHNFYFPAWLAQALLRDELRLMFDFLYSSPDHQSLTATIGNGFIQLDYGNQ